MFKTLPGAPWPLASLPGTPNRWDQIGVNGQTSSPTSASTPYSKTLLIPSLFYKYLRIGSAAAKNASKGGKFRKRTVKHYICTVRQTFSLLGAGDPRHNKGGKTDFRLYRQLRSYHQTEPAPARVKPLPVQILDHV